jgi:pyridoxal phosphate enzyme (YggS family)
MELDINTYQTISETVKPAIVIAVTKYDSTIGLLSQCIANGVTDVGENRVLETITKQDELGSEANKLRWHLIGHLQSKKVPKTLKRFNLIHSVDSIKLAEKIHQVNSEAGCRQPILLQVNIAEESQKYGFHKADLLACFHQLLTLSGIEIQGLMCMAPHEANKDQLDDVFSQCAQLKKELETTHNIKLPHLSMGMSDDYQHALPHGATLLRLGRILLADA